MKMVCIKCNVELRVKQNGVEVVEMFLTPPVPYAIWDADLWYCPKCGMEVISGFGQFPLVHHSDPTFQERLDRIGEQGIKVFER